MLLYRRIEFVGKDTKKKRTWLREVVGIINR